MLGLEGHIEIQEWFSDHSPTRCVPNEWFVVVFELMFAVILESCFMFSWTSVFFIKKITK